MGIESDNTRGSGGRQHPAFSADRMWTAAARAQDARLLGQIQLALVVLGVIALALEVCMAGSVLLAPDWGRIAGMTGLLSVIGCYLLNRAGFFRTSVILSVILPAVYIIWVALTGAQTPQVWVTVYLLIPIIIANTFLRQAMVIGLGALFVATLLTLPLFLEVHVYELPVVFILLVTALLLIGRHHTERQEITRRTELAQSRERYRSILETVFEGVIIESQGEILEVNQGAMNMLGYTGQDQAPGRIADFIPRWEEVCDTAEAGVEVVARHASGSALIMEMVVRRLPHGETGMRIVALRDMTERRDAERDRRDLQAQVLRAQKLESLGMLAGGMAHDFNNMLTAILGQAELMRLDVEPNSPALKSASAIEHAARRAAELTQKLLNFARRGPHTVAPFSLHELVGEVTTLLRRTVDRSIEIEEDLRAESCVVRGDAGQMQQVLMNLALNSCDAMPNGGRLRIVTRDLRLTPQDSRCETGLAPGTYVQLSVIDTGFGIPQESLDRIFDPFFTTKDPGKGTGLGLAMAYGIVQSHQGLITVDSEVGRGTTFHILLPVTIRQPAQKHAEASTPQAGSGEVLLVDDEPDVRDAVGKMLARLGYQVTTATNGQEAVDIYRQRPKDFRLIVLDMVMPVMDGASCFRALQAINPDVRALLSTGYDINDRAQEVLDNGMRGFVRKPYRLHELAAAIDAALKD